MASGRGSFLCQGLSRCAGAPSFARGCPTTRTAPTSEPRVKRLIRNKVAALGCLAQALQTGTFRQTSSALWLFLQREDQTTEASASQLVLTSPSSSQASFQLKADFYLCLIKLLMGCSCLPACQLLNPLFLHPFRQFLNPI